MSKLKKTGFYIIYKVTSPSGKVYIGYTQFKLKERMILHRQEANKGTKRPFYNALRKYKISGMKWEIIATYQNRKYALNREQYFISKYNSTNKNFGYNVTKGGEGTSGLIRYKQRTKIIDNNGNIYFGIVEASEKLNLCYSKLKISVKFGYWCDGYYFSKYIDGMTSATAPKTCPKRTRKITNITTGETFNSITEASRKYNISHQRIYRVCCGKRMSVHGYKFVYSGE